jgi:DNA-directed RNA polymerase subunit K/omega
MIRRPDGMGTFEFVAIASLRAAQLMAGCVPRVAEKHTTAVTAQLEVSEGKVTAVPWAFPLPGLSEDA